VLNLEGEAMGLLWRILAPKPAKRVRRSVRKATHPVRTTRRAVTPKIVKRTMRAGYSVARPLETLERAAQDAIVASVTSSKTSPRSGRAGRQTTMSTVDHVAAPRFPGQLDVVELDPVFALWLEHHDRYRRARAVASTSREKLFSLLLLKTFAENIVCNMPRVLDAAHSRIEEGHLDAGELLAWCGPLTEELRTELELCDNELDELREAVEESEVTAVIAEASVAYEQAKLEASGAARTGRQPSIVAALSDDLARLFELPVHLNTSHAEAVIAHQLETWTEQEVKAIQCPEVAPEAGATFVCKATMTSGRHVEVHVTQTNAHGEISFPLPAELMPTTLDDGPPTATDASGAHGETSAAPSTAHASNARRSALTTRERAQLALSAALGDSPNNGPDEYGRVANLRENIVASIDDRSLATVIGSMRAGAGGELTPSQEHDRPKMHSAHSSAALVVNAFGPWLNALDDLELAGQRGFKTIAFEQKCPTDLRGTPPHLDVVARGEGRLVAVESKCIEYLTPTIARFSEAY